MEGANMKNKELVWNHLADYKRNVLGVQNDGEYRGKCYPHILPDRHSDLNFLEEYRHSLSDYAKNNGIKLHKYFHHLNSSQAVALNFFFPFIEENRFDLLAKLLQLDGEVISKLSFEKVLDSKERTNVDVFLSCESGRKVFIEVKYTEDSFGKAANDERHLTKYKEIYKDRITNVVNDENNTAENMFKYYQLLRNASYIDVEKNDLFIVVYPKWNDSAEREMKKFLSDIATPEISSNIRVFYWEDLVTSINTLIIKDTSSTLQKAKTAFSKFEEKYFAL